MSFTGTDLLCENGISDSARLDGAPSRPWVLKPTSFLFHLHLQIFPVFSSYFFSSPPRPALGTPPGGGVGRPLWSEASSLYN